MIKSDKLIATIYFLKIEAVFAERIFLLAIVNLICQNSEKIYVKYLSPKAAGLLMIIVLGDKASFSMEFLHKLQITGIYHNFRNE